MADIQWLVVMLFCHCWYHPVNNLMEAGFEDPSGMAGQVLNANVRAMAVESTAYAGQAVEPSEILICQISIEYK